jgi:hypothetical protein
MSAELAQQHSFFCAYVQLSAGKLLILRAARLHGIFEEKKRGACCDE